MKSELPLRKFKKALDEIKVQGFDNNKKLFWHLVIFGQSFVDGKKIMMTLWFAPTLSKNYPVSHFSSDYLKIDVPTKDLGQYYYGAIYDSHGYIASIPNEQRSNLISFVTSSKKIGNVKRSQFYRYLVESNFNLTPKKEDVLRGFPYYELKNSLTGITVLVPLYVIIKKFFFDRLIRPETINKIIRSNLLFNTKHYKMRHGAYKVAMIEKNNELFMTDQELIRICRYFYTKSDTGLKALKELAESHRSSLFENKKTYLNTFFPFSDDLTLKFLGQYIDKNNKILFVYNILGIENKKTDLFTVDNIKIIKPKKRKVNPEDNHDLPSVIPKNDYEGIVSDSFTDNPHKPSSHVIEIEKPILNNDSFDLMPSYGTIEGSQFEEQNTNIVGVKEGDKFNEITTNSDEQDPHSESILGIEAPQVFEWYEIAVRALKELCSEEGFSGYFLKIDKNDSRRVSIQSANVSRLISRIRENNYEVFDFLMFELIYEDRRYYFLDRGANHFSSFFNSESFMALNSNSIKKILKMVYSVKHRGNWTSKLLKLELYSLDERILVHSSMVHRSTHNKNEPEKELVERIKTKIFKRIKISNSFLKSQLGV